LAAPENEAPHEARGVDLSISPEIERHQFVLAVFNDRPGLHDAIDNLLASEARDSQSLFVLDASTGPQSRILTPHSWRHIQSCRLNGRIDADHLLRHAIASGSPFSALWDSMRSRPDGEDVSNESVSPRIFHKLTHHLAEGAAVLIVRVDGAERQRSAARTLLDCKCEVLLTHEVAVRHG
jgi:hypothetical protein